MNLKNVLVAGEPLFLDRHRFLLQALEPHVEHLSFLPRNNEWYEATVPRTTIKGLLSLYTGSRGKANAIFQKNHWAFIAKSKQTERRIQQLSSPPDLVFHIFGTYSPFWENYSIPYVMYLDYVLALAERHWPAWATFLNQRSREAWYACERKAFQQAQHIFVMSHVVKRSLVQDYGIEPDKITVVGVTGDFDQPYAGQKTFGTQKILFNGSDFERKGGDVVVAAFERVKASLPEAELVVIGKNINSSIPGIRSLGAITSKAELEKLFLASDLVVAPARCEPFGIFNIEAMNYGVPCILAPGDGNGMPDFLDHEVDGILLKQLDTEELAQQMIRLLTNPAQLQALSDAARQKVKTQLTSTSVMNQIVQKLNILQAQQDLFAGSLLAK